MKWLVRLCLAAAALVGALCAWPGLRVWVRAVIQEPAYQARPYLQSPPTLMLLVGLAATALALVITTRRVLARWPVEPARIEELAGCENGALVFEFALVFPFILALVFILFQWVEILMADTLTHYAAFACARVAATRAAEASPTRYLIAKGDDKHQAMEQAASFALNPAMAMEATQNHVKPTVDLLDDGGAVSPTVQTEQTPVRAHKSVGVTVNWSFAPKWPLIVLFFRPILTSGRIPMARTYRMEIEPYVQARDEYEAGKMPYREEITRLALHHHILNADHHLVKVRPIYQTASPVPNSFHNNCTGGLGVRFIPLPGVDATINTMIQNLGGSGLPGLNF